MKRILSALLILGLLALAGCAGDARANDTSSDIPPEPQHTEPAEIQPTPGEDAQGETPAGETPYNPLEGLTRDQYEGLTVSAVVLPRMAILPGSAIPVTVTVENTGDRTVVYVQGSGSYQTPDALVVQADGLQPVPFRDRAGGIATMDYVVKELEPGETLEYLVYVMAVEPDESFRDYTFDLYNAEGLYIADAEFSLLQERYPDITPAQPGSYPVEVSFVYGLLEAEGDMPVFAEASGYAQAELLVAVSD